MLTEDYLMRMINLAVAALLRAIGLRKEGQYIEAQQAVDQAIEQLTGLRADLLLRLDDLALLDTLLVQGELDGERALLLADLFREQGEIEQALGYMDRACANRLRALTLCLEVALSDETGSILQDKIDGLIASAEGCQASFETRFTLYGYYENIGSYAKAEQILADLRNESNYPEEMRREYQDFCQRMLEKPAAELERGGLRRNQNNELIHQDANPAHKRP
jgi:hypothetical protein